ncbi:MAG: hypothetical protein LH614_04200 [Pyrinomonadaceae bacterium]|nr:hypothetical protein [Pyrinomonadaceae bacterium]
MAFGFPAYFTETIFIPIQRHEFNQIVKEVLESLECKFIEISAEEIHSTIGINALSWGEKIKVKFLSNRMILVESRCVYPLQCFDWGKNKGNVQLLISKLNFAAKRVRDFADQDGIGRGFDENGFSRVEKVINESEE